MSNGHGWRFMELSGLAHAGPLHLVRVIFYSHDDTDVLQAYDGITSAGRQVLYIAGEDAKGEAVEVGAKLTNGLYVTNSGLQSHIDFRSTRRRIRTDKTQSNIRRLTISNDRKDAFRFTKGMVETWENLKDR